MPQSPSVLRVSSAPVALVAIVIFLVAHGALLLGVGTPDKFYFDEVHYVPAARQMLEPGKREPMLNPMHPPLAKQMIALSIRVFGDNPFGWRYPGTLFGAITITAVFLGGLALFGAIGPAIAASLIAFSNQMLFVQSRIAMLDMPALGFSLLAIAAFLHGFRQRRPHLGFALAGLASGFAIACKWSGLFVLATCILIVAVIGLLQGWRTRFADGGADDWYRPDAWPDFRLFHFTACFMLLPAVPYLASFVALHGFSPGDILEAQRRIFADNTTTAIADHTYMSSWPSWPLLLRPVWYLFDNVSDDKVAAVVLSAIPWCCGRRCRRSRYACMTGYRPAMGVLSSCFLSTSGPIWPGRCCRGRSASSITTFRPRRPRVLPWSMP